MLQKKIILIITCVFIALTRVQAEPRTSLILGISLEPPHLDPTAGAAAAIDEIVYGNIFEGLTRISENNHVLPALAKDWENIDENKTFIFTLHENVNFHDGTPFSADDVKYSLDRARGEHSVNAHKKLFYNIKDITVINKTTVKITLKQPQKEFLWNLALGDSVIVSKESALTNKRKPIGTGPFKFQSWKKGSSITLIKNKEWSRKPIFLDKVEFRIIPDPTASLAALFSGEIHAFPFFPAYEARKQIEDHGQFHVSIGWTEGETLLAINHKRFPLNILNMRRALAHAIDRQSVIEGATFTLAHPIGSHCPPFEPACQEKIKILPYNPQKAKKYIEELGLQRELSLILPPTTYARRSGEIIALQLRQVGIHIKIIPVEWANWMERVFKNHDFDLTIIAHTEPKDIDIFARENYYLGYHNPLFKEILEKLNQENQETEYKNLMEQAQNILTEDVAAVFLYGLPKMSVWNKKLKGLWVNAPIPANDLTHVRWIE